MQQPSPLIPRLGTGIQPCTIDGRMAAFPTSIAVRSPLTEHVVAGLTLYLGITMYYFQRGQPGERIQAFPTGLMMIGGNPYHRVFNPANVADHAVQYSCFGG